MEGRSQTRCELPQVQVPGPVWQLHCHCGMPLGFVWSVSTNQPTKAFPLAPRPM